MAEAPAVQELEHGNIYFFYRPRVEEEDPTSAQDVQNLYMVLAPSGKNTYRRVLVGRQRLPDPSRKGRQRMWGFVDLVRDRPEAVVEHLREEAYETKTRGERHQPAARPAGEGVYGLSLHGDHTHLVYALELPRDRGEVQTDLQIEDEASYVVTVRNPDTPAPRGAGLPHHERPHYPKHLRSLFRGRKFAETDPPELLDHEGTEIILVAAAEDVHDELGIDLNPEEEDAQSAEIFRELRVRKSERPVAPLLEGRWS